MVTRDEWYSRDAAADDADKRAPASLPCREGTHEGCDDVDAESRDTCACECHDETLPMVDCRWRASAWAGFKEPPGCIAATCSRCGDCAKHCVCDYLDNLKGDDDATTGDDDATIDPGHEAK